MKFLLQIIITSVCVIKLLKVYAIPTTGQHIIYSDDIQIKAANKVNESDSQSPPNYIPLCEATVVDSWKEHPSVVSANPKIQLKKYFLGYRFDEQLKSYKGRVGIHFTVLDDNIDRLYLHSISNNITSFSLETIPTKNANTSNGFAINNEDEPNENESIQIHTICNMDSNSDVIFLNFSGNFSSDKDYKLDIEFNGVPLEGMNGIYRSQYQVPLSNNTKSSTRTETIISTHFEPTYARQAFPCFDEPSMKAIFSIYLTHPKTMKSFSNMPISLKTENADGTVTVFFQDSPPMSTYLMAFSINNYSVISKISDSINRVNVSVLLPSHMIRTGEFALDVATEALKLFESLTLIPYALDKLDLIGIPSFEAGAMENWGLITFRLTQMVFDNDTVSIKGKEFVAQTVIHEISHQWFGNYVTMKSWYDIWLNEGFATFMEIYATDRLFPQWNILVEERTLYMDSAIGYDQLDATHAMVVPANNTKDIKTLFDAISYTKSGNVLKMVHEVMGDEAFWTVIKKYLNKYAFSAASSTDLWNILNEEIKTPYVSMMIHSWIFNTGFPVITVTMQNKTKEESLISISQKRFIMSPKMEEINSLKPEKWTVPILYEALYDSNNTMYNGIFWLTETTQEFKMNGTIKMIKINKERMGFYVTQYDPKIWEEIIHLLETDKNMLSASDKISLLSDSMRLSKNGMLEFDIPIRLLKILVNDLDYYIQINCVGYLESIGWLINNNEEVYNKFKQLMRAYLHQRYQQLHSLNNVLNLTARHKTIFLSMVSSLCAEYNCSGVVKDLHDLYKEWERSKIKMDPGLFAATLKAVAINGKPEDIKSLEDNYKSNEDPHLKRRFLFALAQVKDEKLLERYLNESIFNAFAQIQELGSFIALVSSNKHGTNLTWNFIKKYWPQIKLKLVNSEVTLSSLIPSVAAHFKTPEILKELTEFYELNKNSIFEKDYKIAMETVQMNVDWSARVLQNISQKDIFSHNMN